MPPWGHEYDFNTQVDVRAAEIVAASASLTLVPLPVAMHATLKGRDLGRLRTTGPLGDLPGRAERTSPRLKRVW